MRFILVLAITISVLLAFGVACGGDEKGAQLAPSPATESNGGVEDGEEVDEWEAEEEAEWEAEEVEEEGDEEEVEDEGEPAPLRAIDSDEDGFDDVVEEDWGSEPLDFASVPEIEDINPGSCSDDVDNDGDGLTDGADPGCPEAGPVGFLDSDDDGFDDVVEEDHGSDPFDDASVPETEDVNPDSCIDDVDNDGDGLTDGVDPGCP